MDDELGNQITFGIKCGKDGTAERFIGAQFIEHPFDRLRFLKPDAASDLLCDEGHHLALRFFKILFERLNLHPSIERGQHHEAGQHAQKGQTSYLEVDGTPKTCGRAALGFLGVIHDDVPHTNVCTGQAFIGAFQR